MRNYCGCNVRCPYCSHDDSRVLDSRAAEDGAAVRRRRQCLSCDARFTTYERIDELPVYVLKRSGDKEPFDRQKIVSGLEAATKGRPVTPEALVDAIRTATKCGHLLADENIRRELQASQRSALGPVRRGRPPAPPAGGFIPKN